MRAATLKTLVSAQWTDPTGMTLRAYVNRFLERRELDGLHRSVANDRSKARRFIEPAPFADKPLAAITRPEVQRYIKSLATWKIQRTVRTHEGTKSVDGARTLSRGTIKHAAVLLSSIFEMAIEDEIIEVNPVRGVKVPKIPSTKEPWTFLTLAEIDQVLSSDALPIAAKAFYGVSIFTGLRPGEAFALRWQDVLFRQAKPELVVRFSHGSATKSGKVRRVPLLPMAVETFRLWHDHRGGPEEGLVFPNREGSRRRKGEDLGWQDRRQIRGGKLRITPGLKTKAGIKRDVRQYDMRHTFASHLVMGSWGRAWRLEEIQPLMGHAAVTTTARYAHLAPDGLHKAAAETMGTFEAPPEQPPQGPRGNAQPDAAPRTRPTLGPEGSKPSLSTPAAEANALESQAAAWSRNSGEGPVRSPMVALLHAA